MRLEFDGFGLPLKGASVTIPFKEEAATVAVFRGESVANTLVRRSTPTLLASSRFTTVSRSRSAILIRGYRPP